MSRGPAAAIIAWVAAWSVTGCAPPIVAETERRSDEPPDLVFDYQRIGGSGYIDQTLSIDNPGDRAVAPTLSFVALDHDGAVLEDVEVSTAYGSDRGWVVAPADDVVIDILRFDGPGMRDVRDVEVRVTGLEVVAGLDVAGRGSGPVVQPEVSYLGAGATEVEEPWNARTVRISNPGGVAYPVRVIGIDWEQPSPGQSQQAAVVTQVGGPSRVEAGGSVDVRVPGHLRRAFASLKVYVSVT